MGKIGIKTACFGLALNFLLFAVKLYIGISSGSLSIYCDSINNLGDALSCVIALVGFILVAKLDELRGSRAQALISFVIGLVIALTGAYFAYQGLERLMYPTLVSYSLKYAAVIFCTVFVKLGMGFVFLRMKRKTESSVISALCLDSFMDAGVTITALAGFGLANRLNFAIDGVMSLCIGIFVCVTSAKTVLSQAKYLINN